jgi:acetylornithine deacetylase
MTETSHQPDPPPRDSAALDPELLHGDPTAWTRALVAVPSVNPSLEPGGAGEGPSADLLLPYLKAWGFSVDRSEPLPGRVSLVARMGNGSPVLGLCGHLDTVGVASMSIPPFRPEIREGRLFGRGSADMKSGLAAILATAAAVARDGGPDRGTLALVFTADEEHASLGLRHLLDGGFTADAVVVTEPTSLALAPANKGFLWATVRARGRASHGSRPDVGRDAIRQMGRVLAALDEGDLGLRTASSAHPLLGSESLHAGTIQGGEAPSIYPEHCQLELEFRLLPDTEPAAILHRLSRLLERVEAEHPGVSLHLEPGMVRPGAELPGEAPLARLLGEVLEVEGLPARVEGMTAWVESAWFMEAGVPSLCFGPGSIGEAHTADESVPLTEIQQAASVLARLAHRILGTGDEPRPGDEAPG